MNKRYSMLLVDDENITRMGMKACIDWEKHGIETVYEAENGLQALEILRTNTIDIMITDIKMAGMDGIELLREMEELPPRTHVIVMSCYNDYETMRSVMQHGVKDFLFKPQMYPSDIEQAIEKVLRSLQKENEEARPPAERGTGRVTAGSYRRLFDELTARIESGSLPLREAKNEAAAYIVGLAALYDNGDNVLKLFSRNLFDHLFRLYQCAGTGDMAALLRGIAPGCEEDGGNRDKMLEALDYINANIASPTLGMEAVASHVDLSFSYFSRQFKNHIGMSYVDYVTDKRLEIADHLYRATNLKIYEIAEKVGYTNAQYFSKIYKSRMGESMSVHNTETR